MELLGGKMIRFIELNGEFIFKWDFNKEYENTYGWEREKYTSKRTHTLITKLKGNELIDWLQTYGLTPDKMFKGTNPFDIWFNENDNRKEVDVFELNKAAEEWKEKNKELVEKNPWTVVGMNGGYVLISNGSKENTVELGSASIVNLDINNSNVNNIKNNPSIDIRAKASLI